MPGSSRLLDGRLLELADDHVTVRVGQAACWMGGYWNLEHILGADVSGQAAYWMGGYWNCTGYSCPKQRGQAAYWMGGY